MRSAYIVFAHPEPRSFTAAMRDVVRQTLRATGWRVSDIDLYAAAFDPVAKASDFRNRRDADYLVYALEQRHAYETGSLPADVRQEVDRIIASELLVLVFPVFWFSMPAILKGWIDRVFVSGLFFGGRRIYDRGGMIGKRALVVASLGGREQMFGPDGIHGELSGMLRHLLQGTLAYVGFDVLQPFFAWHVPYIDRAARAELLRALAGHVARVDELPALPKPSLERYDERLLPLAPRDTAR
jgi:NAD(P)H dehydrogenase (quinone)